MIEKNEINKDYSLGYFMLYNYLEKIFLGSQFLDLLWCHQHLTLQWLGRYPFMKVPGLDFTRRVIPSLTSQLPLMLIMLSPPYQLNQVNVNVIIITIFLKQLYRKKLQVKAKE